MPNSKHPRRIGRVTALQAIYAYEISNEDKNKILKDTLSRHSFDNDMEIFVKDLFYLSVKNKKWCEEKIIERLNNWEFERVALLDRLLLILAISEIFFIDDVPPKVSISEAIEIAKQYSTEESPGFINGVLDNIYKSIPNEVNSSKV